MHMNLAEQIRKIISSATPEEKERLFQESRFDHYNKVGVNFLSPTEAAARLASLRRLTFSASLNEPASSRSNRSWTAPERCKTASFEEMPLAA